jgi:dihydroorotase
MSKFVNLGMPLSKIIFACTYAPASAICEERKIGQLKVGSIADISVFELRSGKFEFYDSYDNKLIGDKKLVPIMTFKNGKLIYSCND